MPTDRESRLEANPERLRNIANQLERVADGYEGWPNNARRIQLRIDAAYLHRLAAALALPAETSGDQQRRMTGGRASQCGCGAWWRVGDGLVEWFCDKHRPTAPEPSDAREGGSTDG